jgi:anti-anti-sigma factor
VDPTDPVDGEALQIDVQRDAAQGRVVVLVRGEIDPLTAPQLEREVDAAVLDGHDLVIDLHDVDFMDSSGLAVLINAHRTMRDRGGQLIVRQPSEVVARLLEISQLTGDLVIQPR